MHFLFHGVGGLIGGTVGFVLFVWPIHCSQQLGQPCTNALHHAPLPLEGAVPVCALIGIVVYHVLEAILDGIGEALSRKPTG